MEQTKVPVLYDAHVHLSDTHYLREMGYVLLGMERMRIAACCVSTNPTDSADTMRLAETSGLVLPFVGIHPQFAGSEDPETICEMAAARRPSGIGEIGLDPTYDDVPPSRQRHVFSVQLALAERLGIPVSVHSRKSLGDVLDTLTSYRCRTLLHWFDGSKGMLRRAMDMDMYVSYGPLMVYAQDKRRLMSLTRPDRVLAETDGPVPFSRCFSQLPAHVAFLPSVVFAMSETLGLTYADMLDMLYANTRSYLGAGTESGLPAG